MRKHAGLIVVVVLILAVWAHASGHLFWYGGNQGYGVRNGVGIIWDVGGCGVGIVLDTGTHEYGACWAT